MQITPHTTLKVKSSDGKTEYTVMHFDTFSTCDCLGFKNRGKCKHIKIKTQKIDIMPRNFHISDFMSVGEKETVLYQASIHNHSCKIYLQQEARLNLRELAEELLAIPEYDYSTYDSKTDTFGTIIYS